MSPSAFEQFVRHERESPAMAVSAGRVASRTPLNRPQPTELSVPWFGMRLVRNSSHVR